MISTRHLHQNETFANLQGHEYVNLVTFRKNGEPVNTPVWFAKQDQLVYIITDGNSGKVQRIHDNAMVELAPCTLNGRVLGKPHEGMAQVIPPERANPADDCLKKKYGVFYRLYKMTRSVLRKNMVFLEVTPM